MAFKAVYNGACQTKVWARSLGKPFTPPGSCDRRYAVRASRRIAAEEIMGILLKPKPTKKTRMTVREYFELPTDAPYETLLIYGELVTMPRPRPKHNSFLHDLGELLRRWIRHMKLGMLFFDNDLILDEENALVYAPDLMFLANEHLSQYREDLVYGPVDLAVEILSPSERPFLQNRKFTDYEQYGIPWYWIIDPLADEPALREHELAKGKYQCRNEIVGEQWFEPGVFPGLAFRLPQLLKGDLKAAVKGKAKKLM
jgi:Uma2 family endonuclease